MDEQETLLILGTHDEDKKNPPKKINTTKETEKMTNTDFTKKNP